MHINAIKRRNSEACCIELVHSKNALQRLISLSFCGEYLVTAFWKRYDEKCVRYIFGCH